MEKVLLAVGSAPCALEDYALAKKWFPNSETMLINGACSLIEDAEHMLAGHMDKAAEFVNARAAKFPFANSIRVHATSITKHLRRYQVYYPMVTDWHGGEMSSGATSAGKAALIGLSIGFDKIILCGCPMDGSGYDPNEAQVSQMTACQRIGDPRVQDRSTIKRYREKMISLAQTTFKGRVYSMSGFTRLHLGPPPHGESC